MPLAFGTRVIAWLAVCATTVLLAACGGGDDGRARLTLTDDDCTYQGDETPPATRIFYAEVENRSSKFGAFELVGIDAGGTFAGVEAYVKEKQRRLEEGLETVRSPPFLIFMARTDVPFGESGVLVADLRPGRYALLCKHVATLVGMAATLDGTEPRSEIEHPPTAYFLVTRPLEVVPD